MPVFANEQAPLFVLYMEMSRLRSVLQFGLFVCLALAASAAEHHGVVKFGGLPLPGATVTISQGDKHFAAITDQQGAYSFPDLPDGVWTIQVEMLCFAPVKQEIGVMAGAPSPEWEMKLLPLDQMQAEAKPAAAAPAAAPAQQSAAPPPKQAPAAQKGFQRTDVTASADAASPESNAESIAGTDAGQNAPDAFVVNGSVGAGIERRAIGNARKGFGMMYRGDIFSTFANSALNARPFSLTGQDTPRAAYNYLKFGGSFGGPLYIPRILSNNGQFFLTFQSTRSRNASTTSALVPTAVQRAGDFSNLTVVDPSTGLPFPGGMVPRTRISPQAQALLALYPQPNFPLSSGYNYQVPIVGVTNQDEFSGRFNRNIGHRDVVSGGFGRRGTTNSSPNLFGFVDGTNSAGMMLNTNWRHIFSQRFSLTFGYQYSRMSVRLTPWFANRENVSGEAGITGNDQDPVNWGPPNLTFSSGIATLTDAQSSFTRQQTSGASFTGLWVRRPHNLTFGGDYRRLQSNNLSQQNPRGSFAFTGASTQVLADGVPVPRTGSDFAGFLLGIPDTSSIAFGNADKYFRSTMSDAYFTDDWRIATGLTINAGVRWEYGSPITELYGRLVNLDIARGYAAVVPVVAARPTGSLTGRTYPSSLLEPDRHAVQPRISFAWHPVFGSTVVVRGGYGVYYNTSVYQAIAAQMAQQSPLSKSLAVQNTAANPLTLASGFNASPGTTTNTFAVDPDFRVGYSQNWQLSVQRDLTEGVVLTGTYLGIKGTRGVQVFLPNTWPTGAVNPCPSCPAGYAYMTSNGNSTRHAAQLQVVRRFHSGLSANLSYTFSKALDDAALGGRGQGSSVIAQNWLDLRGERGLSNFDQKHLLNFQAQYTTGVGLHGGTLMQGWRGLVLKGWTFITQVSAGSGLPETPVYLAAVRGTGVTGSIRPDYTGAPLYDAPTGYGLNPAAFTAPAAGHWGSAGRNILIGPSQFTMTASAGRIFEDRFDLRFDATNPLNHVTYPSWNAIVTSPQFGLPAQANAMRSLEVTVRWRFR